LKKRYSATRALFVSSTKTSRLKRRSFRKLRTGTEASHHHHVYVVLLDPAVRKSRSVRASNPDADPKKLCLYVGMTGLDPEQRFANHKAGIKSAGVVKRFGTRLLPEHYAHLNPMPFAAAVQMEMDLAEDLRRAGFTVTGGH
jgi:predicted GIY-YIG superfamily endonuclease